MAVCVATIDAIRFTFGIDLVVADAGYILGLVGVDRVSGVGFLDGVNELETLGLTGNGREPGGLHIRAPERKLGGITVVGRPCGKESSLAVGSQAPANVLAIAAEGQVQRLCPAGAIVGGSVDLPGGGT